MNAFKLDRSVQRQLNTVERQIQRQFKQLKIPKQSGWMFWVGAAAVGVVAYLILMNRDLASPPVPLVDPFIDEIGDLIPGVEGAGEEFLPDLPIGASGAPKDAAYVSAYEAEALAANVGERLSVA